VNKKAALKQLLSSVNALMAAMRISTSTVSGEYANIGRYTSYKLFIDKYQRLATQAIPLLSDPTVLSAYDLSKIKGSADLTWTQQKEYFDFAYANAALLKSLIEAEIGFAEDETNNLKVFLEANLRKAVFVPPQKEVEIQNAVESLMVGRGMAKGTDYDRETGRVKTSGKESIPDFILPNLALCLEVKLSTSADKLRAIVDEVNADIRAYATQYDRQLYVIYDVGTIRDEDEFKRDLEDAPGVSVIVVKH
jgi:hypothetical protein